jgi:protein involved in polysaccharide export with SLBB domain
MTKIIFIIFLFLLNANLFSQVNRSITGASPGWIDTLSIERAQKVSDENKGIVDKPIDPEKYIVGPGDEFKVTIMQYEPLELKITVSPDSKIYIPKIGLIEVKENTLKEVYELIKKDIQKVYNTNEIYIVLDKIKQFKVRISGDVKKSMTVNAYSTDRVSEVLDKAGAMKSSSSTRNIKLIRGEGKELVRVDLVKYFSTTDENSNPYLRNGDHIIIPELSEDVDIHISGEIPLKDSDFEFVEGDSLSTLIRLGQGFLKTSFLDSVEFVRYDQDKREFISTYLDLNSWRNRVFKFNEILENDFPLKPGDRVYVRKNPNWVDKKYVKIEGQVKYPGKYPIQNKNTTVADLIKSAGGFTEDAAPELAEYIRREEADKKDLELERLSRIPYSDMSESEKRYFQSRITEVKGMMAINIQNAVDNPDSPDNIIVETRDSIVIPKIKNYIIVQGRVNSPGAIIFDTDLNYLDYIKIAGGFGFRADEKETFITKPGGRQYLASDFKYRLEPGDVILVPPKKEVDFWEKTLEYSTFVIQLITLTSLIYTITRN